MVSAHKHTRTHTHARSTFLLRKRLRSLYINVRSVGKLKCQVGSSDTRCPTPPERDKHTEASIDPLCCQREVNKRRGLQRFSETGSDQSHRGASGCLVVHVSLQTLERQCLDLH